MKNVKILVQDKGESWPAAKNGILNFPIDNLEFISKVHF